MNVSLKLQLYTSKTYTDGSHPVILLYTIDGVRKKKVLLRCLEKDWDAKRLRVKVNVDRAAYKNDYIATEYAKAEKDLYQLKNGEKLKSDLFKSTDKVTLDDAFNLELSRLEREFKSGYYDKILAIRKQLPDTTIDIADIDEKWFARMIKVLSGLGNTNNTIKKKIKLIRGMILRYSHKGVTKEIKSVGIVTTKSVKQKLTTEELTRIEELPLPEGDLITATRDLFIMQVYLRGIRVGDLLQATSAQFDNGVFHYVADKTEKPVSMELIPRAQEVVNRYHGKHPRLFPFFSWVPDRKLSKFENERNRLKHKETCTTVINKYLKIIAGMAGIVKPVSSHIARHTFARMAIDKINNPMITMELLGHSSLAVHQQYLNDIRKDDVLNKAAKDIFE
jgi:integrase/recombinase XerD